MWACQSSPAFMRLCPCRVMMLANALVLLRTPVLIVVQGYTCNPYAYNPLGITAPTSPGSRRQQRLRTQLSASPHGNGRRVLHGNLLEQLQRHTTIWADTANVASVERLSRVGIVDVTTNPSIVSATALGDEDAASALLAQAHDQAVGASALETHECIAVDLGRRLLDVVPGRVCTQVDIRCTDSEAIVTKARNLVAAYTQAGVARERVLIKTPATWPGIRATERLEQEGIRCLVTLVCSQVQGRAAAEAGASIIATYVGRVSDWHKAAKGVTSTTAAASEDRGVLMTNKLKNYFTVQGLKTEVMAASFRCVGQVVALAGCDHLTIAPGLIEEMAKLPPMDCLDGATTAQSISSDRGTVYRALDEQAFLASLGQDVCGTDVLRSSVEGFEKDTNALESWIAANLESFPRRL